MRCLQPLAIQSLAHYFSAIFNFQFGKYPSASRVHAFFLLVSCTSLCRRVLSLTAWLIRLVLCVFLFLVCRLSGCLPKDHAKERILIHNHRRRLVLTIIQLQKRATEKTSNTLALWKTSKSRRVRHAHKHEPRRMV